SSAEKTTKAIKKLFNVSNSNLLATLQNGYTKANVKELIKLINSFFTSLFIDKNKNKIVSAPNIAENKLSL
ncbi:unnamed protein product, partial [marine sediment metagenome]